MIVKDEEGSLGAALEAAARVVDEIIVVDTGSTDGTRAIAAGYAGHADRGARAGGGAGPLPRIGIFDFPWADDFAAARNFSLGKATGDWILVLDADEVIEPGARRKLGDFAAGGERVGRDKRVGQVEIVSEFLSDGEVRQSSSLISRFFPNNGEYHYEGAIHEQIVQRGDTSQAGRDVPRLEQNVPRVGRTGVVVAHSGYSGEMAAQKKNGERNLRILLAALERQPQDPYLAYQAGRTYFVMNDYRQARPYLENALKLIVTEGGGGIIGIKGLPAYLPLLLVSSGYALKGLGDFDALFKVLDLAIGLFPDYTDLHFLRGLAYMESGRVKDLSEIASAFETCLQLGEARHKYESVHGVGSFLALYNLGCFYEALGDLTGAARCYAGAAQQGYQRAAGRLTFVGGS
ncbi:MAG: glycosyltransferase [Firmicutes bacterium]|nr:glycosyltransferase [Bacillota bacterium]